MEFRIADTFTAALARLTGSEQKAVKVTVFDLQANPTAPGLKFHRIDASRDPNFWSLRVGSDVRIIVHKTAASLLLAYVDHHDKAYAWAERRRIEVHPRTGAAQIVVAHEVVEERLLSSWDGDARGAPREAPIVLPHEPPSAAGAPASAARIFAGLQTDQLLSIGVPTDWTGDVIAATEDGFFELAGILPAEASEALLEYAATGRLPVPPTAAPVSPAATSLPDAFAHPDALRRFRVVESVEELRQALDYPWERWTVFLHPAQRELVERTFAGPARVAGSAGTGKTVVALHRAASLARLYPESRILLTTFSPTLARMLEKRLGILLGEGSSVVPRITVASYRDVADELYQLATGRRLHIASEEQVASAIAKAAAALGATEFTQRFLVSEWTHVVDAWQIEGPEAYATVPRLGRRSRLGAKQRDKLWPIFAAARKALSERGLATSAQLFAETARLYVPRLEKPFGHIVVDEAQDLGVAELRFLAAISPGGPDALFFAGDLGQRIFQQPFSWATLGIDVRGRSSNLKVNYRTSHQIRSAADRLLPDAIRDVDGLEEERRGTVSVFDGPRPEVRVLPSAAEERDVVAAWIGHAIADGLTPSDIAIFVRTSAELPRAMSAAKAAGHATVEITERGADPAGKVSIGAMHLAKGLEFKAVAVMACDPEILPLQARVGAVADEAELDDVYETERQLLYVACTRARDRLLVTGVAPGSEFLGDLGQRD